jgi:tetratricopeptide (TPR) repeat protein
VPGGTVDPFLVAPTTGYGIAIPSASASALERGYLALVRGTGADEALAVALALEGDPIAGPPAVVLAAQANQSLGRCSLSIERLDEIAERHPDYVAALLILGRCREQLGDLPGAATAYQRIASGDNLASARLAQIAPAAQAVAVDRIRSWLAAGRLEEARTALQSLRLWAPRDRATLEQISELAEAVDDPRSALALLRELTAAGEGGVALRQRRAALELEFGDAGAGLRILEELAAAQPGDAELGEALERARFAWRLTMLPEQARRLASEPTLDRSQLATLLYWVFPSVRYGRPPADAVIANDVLDHEHRAEIVRIVNLGIMKIDPNLHAFRPRAQAQRVDALSGLLRVLEQSPESAACLGGATVAADLSLESTCSLATQCGLLADLGDCLPQAPLSGPAAMGLVRSTARRLEVR